MEAVASLQSKLFDVDVTLKKKQMENTHVSAVSWLFLVFYKFKKCHQYLVHQKVMEYFLFCWCRISSML
jgi:hypothetical protein